MNKYSTCTLLALVLCALVCAYAAPDPIVATCYIAADGVDTNNCTSLGPCLTIGHCINTFDFPSLGVSIAPGTYGSSNCGIYISNSTSYTILEIYGNSAPANTVIDCDQRDPHFYFENQPGMNVTIRNLTLSNANGTNGGSIFVSNIKAINISSVIFTGNSASLGGALYATGANVSISKSSFTNNRAIEGGALYLQVTNNGSSLDNSVVTQNNAGLGAGIYLVGDYLTMINTNVTYNVASLSGGGFYVTSPTPTNKGIYNFMGSLVQNNTAAALGGGFYSNNLNHTFNVYGAVFTDNLSVDTKNDSNIACNATTEFCYACKAKDCVTDCGPNGAQSCSQYAKNVWCYGHHFYVCKTGTCTCKAPLPTAAKILIAIIGVCLLVGVVLITVDIIKFIIAKRAKNTYAPI